MWCDCLKQRRSSLGAGCPDESDKADTGQTGHEGMRTAASRTRVAGAGGQGPRCVTVCRHQARFLGQSSKVTFGERALVGLVACGSCPARRGQGTFTGSPCKTASNGEGVTPRRKTGTCYWRKGDDAFKPRPCWRRVRSWSRGRLWVRTAEFLQF